MQKLRSRTMPRWAPAAGRGRLQCVRVLAGDDARRGRARTSQPGAPAAAPDEPHRVPQRGARPAGRRGRHQRAARRRFHVRLRHIAAALGVSPLLIESYVTTARKVSRLAVGSPAIPAVTITHKTPEDLTQDYHLRGLPLGTRGRRPRRGVLPRRRGLRDSRAAAADRGGRHPRDRRGASRRADAGRRAGRPVPRRQRGCLPTDGDQRAEPRPDRHEGVHRGRVDARAAAVTAGRHEIVASFVGRPAVLSEEVARPFLRSYVGTSSRRGLPDVDSVLIAGPFDAVRPETRRAGSASSRAVRTAPPTSCRARAPSSPGWAGWPTAALSKRRSSNASSSSTGRGAATAASKRASSWRCALSWPVRSSSSGWRPSRKMSKPAPSIRSRTWISPHGCRSSSGAASRTTSCWRRPSVGVCATRRSWRGRWGAC